jgi:hypothetical protein
MALQAYQLHVFGSMASPSKTGVIPVLAALATTEAPAAVEAANYFDSAAARLPKGSIIMAAMVLGGTPVMRNYIVTANTGSAVTVVRQSDPDSAGGVRAVTATADGLTTGLLTDEDTFVEVTSANADHIVTLPAATAANRGKEILIWVVPSTNCELRTPATTNQTINNVDSDGSAEALLTHTRLYKATQHLATGWVLEALTALGAVSTAIVPD